jgi:hypothetical protein
MKEEMPRDEPMFPVELSRGSIRQQTFASRPQADDSHKYSDYRAEDVDDSAPVCATLLSGVLGWTTKSERRNILGE